MGLLISRPSVFVWGPEACLSAVIVERRALYEGTRICGSENFLMQILIEEFRIFIPILLITTCSILFVHSGKESWDLNRDWNTIFESH